MLTILTAAVLAAVLVYVIIVGMVALELRSAIKRDASVAIGYARADLAMVVKHPISFMWH